MQPMVAYLNTSGNWVYQSVRAGNSGTANTIAITINSSLTTITVSQIAKNNLATPSGNTGVNMYFYINFLN